MLTIIAYTLVKVFGFLSCHDQIVVDITELSVFGHSPLECLRLIAYQLNVELTLIVQLHKFIFKQLDDFLAQWQERKPKTLTSV